MQISKAIPANNFFHLGSQSSESILNYVPPIKLDFILEGALVWVMKLAD
jgi:hypothetical protein